MSATILSALKLGPTVGAGLQSPILGDCAVYQQATITQNSTTAVSATFTLPANSQIISFVVDVLTAYDSGTSATLSIGTSAADTTYISGVSAKTGGRATLAPTAAQVTAYGSIGANTSVVATVTVVGATTAGLVRVLVHYIPPSA